MKAAVHTRYGTPDVVRVSDVDTPAVKDHDVLVKVRYPLDQIVEAYWYVETGQKIGNVVISVDPAV